MNSKIWRFDNANALYYALIDTLGAAVGEIIQKNRFPNLALPTGNTMVPFYRIAAESAEPLQIARWNCFNLDEYYPLNERNFPLSFKAYMEQHFFGRLASPPHSINFLDGGTSDLALECAHYEEKIISRGGIDIALLGLGVNGHIAFNEPGSEFDSRTRAVELHPSTLMANFKGEAPFTHAMTMGIGTLLEAKKIYIVALGKNKAQAVHAAIQERSSRTLPASALQKHPDVTWFLDQEAAGNV